MPGVKVWAIVEFVLILLSLTLYLTALASAQSSSSGYPLEKTLPGYTKYTLILYNDTMVQGNEVQTGNGGNPVSVAYDSENGLIYVATTNGVVSVVNVSLKRVVNTITIGDVGRPTATSIIYVPLNGLIYVGSPSSDAVYVINPSTNNVIDKIVLGPKYSNYTIGPIPLGMVYDPKDGLLYVSSSFTNSVIAIDPSNDSVVANVSVGKYPVSLAIDPSNGLLYVANYLSGTVSVLNTSTNKIVGTIDVAPYLSSIVFDPNTGYLYVGVLNLNASGRQGEGGLYVINPISEKVVTNVSSVQAHVDSLLYDPLNHEIYISETEGLVVFDPSNNSVVGLIPLSITVKVNARIGSGILVSAGTDFVPYGMVTDYSGGCLYVADFGIGMVSVINVTTDKVIANITIGTRPEGIVYDPENGYLYVSATDSDMIYVINPATGDIVKVIYTPWIPEEMTYDPANGALYVASFNGYIYAVSTLNGSIINTFPAFYVPSGLAYDPENGYLYVSSYVSNNVYVVNPVNGNIVATVKVGLEPKGIAYDPENGYIYVTVSDSNVVTVIDPANNSVIANITVKLPYGVAYDTETGYLYVTSGYYNSVLVIDPANMSVIGNISVGLVPMGIAYDSRNGLLYVANWFSGSLSVVQVNVTAYAVTFTEKGLPPGTEWSVTLNGVTKTSNASSIVFYELNGTYPFNVSKIRGYNVSPASGTVTVDGKPIEINLEFEPIATTTMTSTTSTTTTSTTTTVAVEPTTTAVTNTTSSVKSSTTPITTPSSTPTTTSTVPSQTPVTYIVIAVIVVALVAVIILKLK